MHQSFARVRLLGAILCLAVTGVASGQLVIFVMPPPAEGPTIVHSIGDAAIMANAFPAGSVTVLVTPGPLAWSGSATFNRPVSILSAGGGIDAKLGGAIAFTEDAGGSLVQHLQFVVGLTDSADPPRLTALSPLTVNSCEFIGSGTAGDQGGAMHIDADVLMQGCLINGFSTASTGAGIQMVGGEVIIEDSAFLDCHAEAGGGGIDASGSGSLKVDTCSFVNCGSNYGGGGGVRAAGALLQLTECAFLECSAVDGGAVQADMPESVLWTDCTFTTCTASSNGGAVHAAGNIMISGTSTIIDCSAGGDGGAMWLSQGVDLVGHEFNMNEAGGSGGAVALSGNDCTLGGSASPMFFAGNVASGGGGAVSMSGSGHEVSNLICQHNEASTGGAIAVGPGDVTLSSILVEENVAGVGGGLWGSGSGTLSMSGVQMESNTASFGGGMWIQHHDLEIENCLLDKNIISGDGGGAWLKQCTGTIKDTTCANHNSPGNGAGMVMDQCTLALVNCQIAFNTSKLDGAGLYQLDGAVTMNGGHVSYNWGLTEGGGWFAADGSTSLEGCVIEGNAAVMGGGIRMRTGELTLDEVVVLDNTAEWGGGVAVRAGSTTVYGGQFITNEAQEDGGGMHAAAFAAVSLEGTTFSENDGWLRGGGIFGVESDLLLVDCALTGGYAFTVGGGLCTIGTQLGMTDCHLAGNVAALGGGLHAVGSVTVSMLNVNVQGNMAGSDGGGISLGTVTVMFGDRLTLANNMLDPDSAGTGSALFGGQKVRLSNSLVAWNGQTHAIATTGLLYMASSTVAHNQSTILCSGPEGSTVTDSIVWDNWGAGPVGAAVSFSCVEGGIAGDGNIASDPLFVAPDFYDYALAPESPCRDAGKVTLLNQDALDADDDGDMLEYTPMDLTGAPRFMGMEVDMGAFEFEDEIPPSDCDGDFDGDGDIDIADLLTLLDGWGTAEGDVTGDGTTDIDDLLVLIGGWGAC